MYNSGGNGGGGTSGVIPCSLMCFSADTKVYLLNGETKRLDELKIDDWVMSENITKVIN